MIKPYTLRSLWDMYHFEVHSLVEISKIIGQIDGFIKAGSEDVYMPKELSDKAPLVLAGLKDSLKAAQLNVSAGFVDILISSFVKNKKSSEISNSLNQLHTSLIIELQQSSYIGLTAVEAELFKQEKPHMGQDVVDRFPSALYEIDEAGKCLALGRATATVFHLMRILEISICAIHHCLSINVPLVGNNRNWGSILKRIREEIREKDKQNGYQWKDKDNFQDIYARLDAIKDAWRNKTMHVEIKYTEAEAKYLFDTTKAFMQKIASRMDENGLPTV